MQWHEHIEKISSKEDLADFVELLRQDLQAHSEEWENSTLDRFLDAMEAWIRSLDNYYINKNQPIPQSPSWRTFANILYASKIYE